MKCPTCGNEMKPDKLYCEYCGEDVHIVPDFEAEVEAHMQNHLDSLKDVFTKEEEAEHISKRKLFLWLGYLFCVLCIICFFVAGFYLLFQKDKTADDYLKIARNASKSANYTEALKAYNDALELDDSLSEAKLEMVEIYFHQNNMTAYVNLLNSLIRDDSLSDSQLSSCYGKLVAYYDTQGDIAAIQQLITGCNNSAIASQYDEYFAPTPEFDKQSGYYTSIFPVKITDSSQSGAIFYTLDGSDPDETSTRYIAPIVLDNGTTVIKAVYISKANVKSEIASEEYHIEIVQPDPPTVLTVSGEYHTPTMIEVEVEEGDVYYTDDNSKPDKYSILYTGPIEMPYGQSVFRFVTVIGSKVSDETERTFELTMESRFTEASARQNIVKELTEKGEIIDAGDATYKGGELIQYEYLTSALIREKMYLIFAERIYHSEEDYTDNRYLGVDALSGDIVTIQRENNRNYSISD